jgi:flagellar M-ring protein FliF
MAQATRQGITTLARGFTRLSNTQKFGFLAALAALIAAVIVTMLWVRTPEFRVLYSNLSDRDGGEVIAALAQLNVPYRVEQGGGVILVPSTEVYDLRLRLAAQGLPKGGTVGFELMDAQKFGTSQFAEQVNYQRALAGELARSIQSVAVVQSARVHLAIPRPTVFVREQQQLSASVFLAMYPGRVLDAGQVSAIQHLVASSVPELSARNVTIVDQAGNLLSSASAEAGRGMDAAQLKYAHALEAGYATRIEGILSPIVGAENVRAQVTAALDFSQAEQTSETFKPNPAPAEATVRSQQTVESMTRGPARPGAIPGAPSNELQSAARAAATVSAQQPGKAAGGAAAQTSTHRENLLNYEVDKTIRHVREEVGAVKRLSAAVVINYRREVDSGGKATFTPLSEEELKQVNALAREAMGFSQERGDTLNVVNAPFNREAVPLGEPAPTQGGTFVRDLTSPAAMNLLKYLLAAGVVLIALAMARSAIRSIARAARVEPRAMPDAAIEGQLSGGPAAYAAVAGADMEADLRAVKDLARQEPRVVANVVKAWVGRE